MAADDYLDASEFRPLLIARQDADRHATIPLPMTTPARQRWARYPVEPCDIRGMRMREKVGGCILANGRLRLMTGAFGIAAVVFVSSDSGRAAQEAAPSTRTVCGKVQKVTCDDGESRFTTLELKPKSKDGPVTILPASRGKFSQAPEDLYRDTEVCAAGRVESHRGQRLLVVTGEQDVTIQKQLKPRETPWAGPYFAECDEGVVRPVLLREIRPNYTPAAMREEVQGIVTLEAIVGADGTVTETRVRRSLDSKHGLDTEAARVVRLWRFMPATKFGEPVPMRISIEMSFELRSPH